MRQQTNKYDLLIEAALNVMKEKGFEKASVSQIVKEAGVAQGTFYLYFESKSAVVPAIAEKMLSALLTEIKKRHVERDSIFDTIEMIVDVTFDITEEYHELILFCYSGLAYYDSFGRWEEIYQPYYHWLEDQLVNAQTKGTIKSTIRLSSLAKMIINVIETSAETYVLANQSTEAIDTTKNEITTFVKSAMTDCHS
ncbi:TetR family transcriptional regulator [Salipaludibacillus agaradhaerens]|uniref:TetR family transcriptional regulator n=1 Tax=Salipaludibacillus agaradhaerens TaxID=76935 RepID=A0A9Q4G0S2_SALAG|nr:TetR family transcriptional regulator [Salipaludibacillus agaradhaerens]MCR6098806.1 TetR family transcriptional regulator [Salipaludibacillus agaradhaerens]MCR6115813.1 TetR family transcriptional regulator [Salipaludibacillus agaradhaerens]